MSNKKLHRLPVIQADTKNVCVAAMLGLTERQVQRLMNRYRESGSTGLINVRRGKPGMHR